MTNIFNERRNNIQKVLNAEELAQLLNNVINLGDTTRIQEAGVDILKTKEQQGVNTIEKIHIYLASSRKQMSIVLHREFVSNKLYWINLLFDETNDNAVSVELNKISNLTSWNEYDETVKASDFDVESHKLIMEVESFEEGKWGVKGRQLSNNINNTSIVRYFKEKALSKNEIERVNSAIKRNKNRSGKKTIMKIRNGGRISATTIRCQ